MARKIYLETYGCQMNVYDSDLVRSILEKEGYVFTTLPDEGDVLLVNTCTVRETACTRVYGRLGLFSRKKRIAGRPVVIGVLGCMAQDHKEDLLKVRGVDFIVGTDGYRHLPRLIADAFEVGPGHAEIRQDSAEIYQNILPLEKSSATNAFVTIMRGCNNFCSFCVVPLARGRERSRRLPEIREEVIQLQARGYREFTLLGQSVNSYHDGESDFTSLLAAISAIPGVRRLRFTSPHPKDFPRSLLRVIAERENVCKQIHLPVQSGSNRILGLMKRGYTREDFLSLIAEIKAAVPGVHLSTDIIVGFPSETGEEYLQTEDLMRQVEFDTAFIFKYSARRGTAAARDYPETLPEETVTGRIVRLNALQKEIGMALNNREIGTVQEILVERPALRPAGSWNGRTGWNKIVIFPGPAAAGDFLKVKITGASAYTLFGERLEC
jgi:tRNA-2-methylthio-N6-dimethylallyladenosine synthase